MGRNTPDGVHLSFLFNGTIPDPLYRGDPEESGTALSALPGRDLGIPGDRGRALHPLLPGPVGVAGFAGLCGLAQMVSDLVLLTSLAPRGRHANYSAADVVGTATLMGG